MPTIYTAGWLALARSADHHEELNIQPVRISATCPKFWHPSVMCPSVQILIPRPELWQYQDDDAGFKTAYVARLDRTGPDAILERLDEISAEHPGKDLALACYEANPQACLRSLFTSWWVAATGQLIEEWEPPIVGSQLTMGMTA